jgi:long-chain acyl-CoA synthetase
MPRRTLADCLDGYLARGDDIAFGGMHGLRVRRWSYAETARLAYRVARELEARSIAKGDRVLLWAANSPEWVASFFGCVLRGAIVVPLDLQSEPGFAARVQAQASARLALCDRTTAAAIDPALPVITLDELSALTANHSAQRYDTDAVDADDTVEIVFTSGTTTEPKGVRITHRNILTNLAAVDDKMRPHLAWERLVHPVRFLNLVPLSHVFGQFMGIFAPQVLGGSVFFQDSLSPSAIIETVRRERISVIVCVPRTLDTLRDKIVEDVDARGGLDAFRRDFDAANGSHFLRRWWMFRRVHRLFGWKFWAFISGGATIAPDTEDFWQRLGYALIQGYGMTETAALISFNDPFKRRRGSIGKALPGSEMKLADNGEILVRGANVSPGYWNGAAETAEADAGWLRTGDVGELDADGNLYFKGRQKDVIVAASGMNIYPDDIERVLQRQPEVKAAAVVAIDVAQRPEAVAVLILRDHRADPRAIVERTNTSLAPHQRVHRWTIWPDEDFPRTITQKVRKPLVADRLAALLATPASAASCSPRRLDALEDVLSRVTRESVASLDPSATLGADLKLDSLGRVELVSALESRFQVELDEAAFTEATTVGDLDALVRGIKQDESPRYAYPRWQERWPITWLRTALVALVAMPITRIMSWPTIRGRGHVQDLRGPAVFVCNHITLADHAILLLALPRRLRRRMVIAMDAETLHKWVYPPPGAGVATRLSYRVQYVLAMLFFNGLYLPQKSGFRRSFARAGELMDRGYNLMIFPEGQRTKHGRLHPFMHGTGLLISQLNAPVVPVRIDGVWELKQQKRHFARPGEITLTIGPPRHYSAHDEPGRIARDLEAVVRAL